MSQSKNLNDSVPFKYGKVGRVKRGRGIFSDDFADITASDLALSFAQSSIVASENPDFTSEVKLQYSVNFSADISDTPPDDKPVLGSLSGNPTFQAAFTEQASQVNVKFPKDAFSEGGSFNLEAEAGGIYITDIVKENRGGFGNDASEGSIRLRNDGLAVSDMTTIKAKYSES